MRLPYELYANDFQIAKGQRVHTKMIYEAVKDSLKIYNDIGLLVMTVDYARKYIKKHDIDSNDKFNSILFRQIYTIE